MKYFAYILPAITLPALVIGAAQARDISQDITMAERERELSVLTRETPEYDRQGFRFSGLILNADITNSVEYKDNLYSSQTNQTEDILHVIRPALELKSDFNRHAVSASIGAEKGTYKATKAENYTNYSAKLAVRADILGSITMPASIEYRRDHARRSDPEDQGELKPTLYNQLILNTGVDYKGANIDFLINANLKKLTFKDNATPTQFIDNSDRDRGELLISANIGFAKNRVISPFIFADLQKIKYDREIDDNGLKRSSSGFIGGLGLNITPTSSLFGASFRIGMLSRSFDEASFSDINALIYSAKLSWEPSTLLALNLSGQRQIAESTLNNFSSSVDDIIAANAYYELAPNIFLNPKLSYTVKNYEGDIDRELQRTTGEMNITYKINKNIWLLGGYTHIRQSENEDNTNLRTFNSNLYNISMKLQI